MPYILSVFYIRNWRSIITACLRRDTDFDELAIKPEESTSWDEPPNLEPKQYLNYYTCLLYWYMWIFCKVALHVVTHHIQSGYCIVSVITNGVILHLLSPISKVYPSKSNTEYIDLDLLPQGNYMINWCARFCEAENYGLKRHFCIYFPEFL